eukprot:13838501-Alexandrium_andersonii.AAC.1
MRGRILDGLPTHAFKFARAHMRDTKGGFYNPAARPSSLMPPEIPSAAPNTCNTMGEDLQNDALQ